MANITTDLVSQVLYRDLKWHSLVWPGGDVALVTEFNQLGNDRRALVRAAQKMQAALKSIIEMNVQYASDKYGDPAKAESMACVIVAREALTALDGSQK